MVDSDKLFSKMAVFSGKLDQWHSWKRRLLVVLDSSDLLDGLSEERPADAPDGAEQAVVQARAEAQLAWDKRNQTIYNRIPFLTDGSAGSVVAQLEGTRNGREAWRRLLNKYEHAGSMGKAAIQSELIQATMEEAEDPDLYFHRIERLQTRLVELGREQVPDSMMLGIASRNLPTSYKPLIDILNTDDDLTYDTFKARMSTFHRRNIMGLNGDAKGGNPKAFPSMISGQSKPSSGSKERKQRKKGKCNRCGELGHFIKDCRKNKKDDSKGGDKKHFQSKGDHTRWKDSSGGGANQGVFSDETKTTTAFTTHCKDLPLSNNEWIVDSGCSRHMTGWAGHLTNVSSRNGTILVAGGQMLEWVGSGDLTFQARTIHG